MSITGAAHVLWGELWMFSSNSLLPIYIFIIAHLPSLSLVVKKLSSYNDKITARFINCVIF